MPSLLCVHVFVLCLYLHVCTARPIMVSDTQTNHASKLELYVKDSVAEKLATQLGNHAVKESDKNIMINGIKVKIPYSWKISQQANSKREQVRSMLESSPKPCKAEERVNNNSKDEISESVEDDIVVMDYAQPHRKPPIHNRGT